MANFQDENYANRWTENFDEEATYAAQSIWRAWDSLELKIISVLDMIKARALGSTRRMEQSLIPRHSRPYVMQPLRDM